MNVTTLPYRWELVRPDPVTSRTPRTKTTPLNVRGPLMARFPSTSNTTQPHVSQYMAYATRRAAGQPSVAPSRQRHRRLGDALEVQITEQCRTARQGVHDALDERSRTQGDVATGSEPGFRERGRA